MDDNTNTAPAPNPAAESARAEMRAIMTDAAHPLHHAWTRNDSEAVARHMKPHYDRITGPPPITLAANLFGDMAASKPPTSPPQEGQPRQQTDSQADLSPAERVAVDEHNRIVRDTLGDQFETVAEAGRRGAAHLFGSTPEGIKAFEFLAKQIVGHGPATEVKALRALADLGRDLNI